MIDELARIRDAEALARWLHDYGDGGIWESFDRAAAETVARALCDSDWYAERVKGVAP